MLTLIGALDCIELSVFPGIQLGVIANVFAGLINPWLGQGAAPADP